jgi:hypothetical protein
LFSLAYVIGSAAAISWGYFIWGLDWGRFGSRDWGLWAMTFGFGSIVAFVIGLSLVMFLHSMLFPEDSI